MRPCNHCGVPIDNADLYCARCAPAFPEPITTTRQATNGLPAAEIDQNDLDRVEQVILFLIFCSPDVALITTVALGLQMFTGFFDSLATAFWVGIAVSIGYCALAALLGMLVQFSSGKHK